MQTFFFHLSIARVAKVEQFRNREEQVIFQGAPGKKMESSARTRTNIAELQHPRKKKKKKKKKNKKKKKKKRKNKKKKKKRTKNASSLWSSSFHMCEDVLLRWGKKCSFFYFFSLFSLSLPSVIKRDS